MSPENARLVAELRTRARLTKEKSPGVTRAMDPERDQAMREMGRAELLEAAAQAIEDLEAKLKR